MKLYKEDSYYQQSSPNSKSNGAVTEVASSNEDDDFEEVNRHTNKSSDTNTTNSNSNANSKVNDSGITRHRRSREINVRDSENDTMNDDNEDEDASSNNNKLQDKLSENEIREEAEMWKGVGNRHMASQEYSKAYSAYSTSLSLSPLGPSSHIYLSNRAASLLSLKRYSAASVDARRAITLAPTFGKAHARLGQSLYFLHDYAGAVGAYEDAFTYEPENEVTWTYLNKARRKLERKRGVTGSRGLNVKKAGWDTTESDSITANAPYSPSSEGESIGNDMISVTDSINLKNMKITVDDASDKKNINAAVMRDQISDNKIDGLKENNDGFYEEILDLSVDSKNLDIKDTMQKAVAKPPHRSLRDANTLQIISSHSYQSENESTPFPSAAIECNKIGEHPTDESDENSVFSNQEEANHKPRKSHHPTSQYSPSYENDDAYTTRSDPDFDEAVKIQQSASTHLLHRRYKIAVEEFSAALFLVPDDDNLTPSLFVGRAYALNGQGRHLSAQNDAMMALGRRPDLADGHVALARSLFYAGDLRGAVRSFENASVCLQRNFGDIGGGGVEDDDDGSGLSKLDQLYLEKALAGLIEREKEGNIEDDEKSHGYSILSGSNKPVPKLQPPRFVPREKLLKSSSSVPSMPKAWSIQVPQSPPSLRVGPERLITFFSHCLGIKLNRGSDGIIRVVSVTEDTNFSKAPPGAHQVHRKGSVESGDVVREAAGVDLRRPITKFMWSDTVSLLKVSPRPVKLIVSKELSESPLGFANEVSKSMVQTGVGRNKWGGLRDRDTHNHGEEEKQEIVRIPNMPKTYGGPNRPSRSGSNEAVAESIRAMTIDEDFIGDNDVLPKEVTIVSEIGVGPSEATSTVMTVEGTNKMDKEKDVAVVMGVMEIMVKDDIIDVRKREHTSMANAHSSSSLAESAALVRENDKDTQQDNHMTHPNSSNSVELETAGGVKDSNNDVEENESAKREDNNICKGVEVDTTMGSMSINEDNKVLATNPDVENKTNIESEAFKPKNDNSEKQQNPATKPDNEINIGIEISNTIEDAEKTKTVNTPRLKARVCSIPKIVKNSTEAIEDLTIKSSISMAETNDGTNEDDATRKTKNAKSRPDSPTSDTSLDGLSFSPLDEAASVAGSRDESTTITDISYEDESDSGLGIGMLDTLRSPHRKKIDGTEGLVDEDPLYRKEILFVRSEKDAHSSSSSSSPTLGWTNDLWLIKSSHRVLVYSRHVQLLTKGRFFWSADQYVPRVLALYTNPNLILVLRPPLNVSEVKESLNIPELDLSSKRADTNLTDLYWVAERVIDLNTCKIRLSQLTTPTSVVVQDTSGGGGESSENEHGPITDCRRATCFELINPLENVIVSAVVVSPSIISGADTQIKKEELNSIYSGKSAISVTLWWESAIAKALCAAHAPYHLDGSNGACSDKSWKHQIVLGSLHSHVVSGSYAALQKAIEIIKKASNTHPSPAFAPHKASLDRMDENGMTALHYACNSRFSSAVSMLVKAGADCTIPTKSECKTPCHLSAELLDQTSISVILAASKSRRPDPNALDSYGQTPMYSAAVYGRSVTGGSDQLKDCLLAFEAWGGQLYLLPNAVTETSYIMKTKRISRQKNRLSAMEEVSTATNQVKVMPHPVHSISADWRHAELETLFAFCSHRYPIDLEGQFGFGRSLGALFDYPLHACAISLRKKVIEFKQKRRSDMFGQATGEPSLISTLRVLLNHGLEPNERLEYINSATEFALEMNEMTGFTPAQILAGAALDIISDQQDSEGKGLDADPSLEFVSFYIAESVELLVQHGARISMDSPPVGRPNRENPLQHLVLQLLRGGMTSLPMVDRGKLNIERNSDIIGVIGGKSRLSRLRTNWHQAKAVKAPSGCKIRGKEFPSSVPDFDLPGGSDSTNCAICWKIFGLLRNRKHICRLSRRYVCEDCSSKSVTTMDGEGTQLHRISDGQYTYSRIMSERKRDQDRIELQERTRARRERIEQLQSARKNNATTGRFTGTTTTETAEREELFLGSAMGRAVKNFFMEGGPGSGTIDPSQEHSSRIRSAEKSAQDQLGGIASSLNKTKDALNERGERLNTLGDKTRELKDASADFASMAKELNKKSQSNGLFW